MKDESFTHAAVTCAVMLATIAVLWMSIGIASAGVVFTQANKAGGQIRFTDKPCEEGYMVSSRTPSGITFFGCWKYSGDLIWVLWSNGSLRTYLPASVIPTDYYRTEYGKDST